MNLFLSCFCFLTLLQYYANSLTAEEKLRYNKIHHLQKRQSGRVFYPPQTQPSGFNWGTTTDRISFYDSPEKLPTIEQLNWLIQRRRSRTSTTPEPGQDPPAKSACERNCQFTREHNPICADNKETFKNIGQLKCAQRCGRNLKVAFYHACKPVKDVIPYTIREQ